MFYLILVLIVASGYDKFDLLWGPIPAKVWNLDLKLCLANLQTRPMASPFSQLVKFIVTSSWFDV